jgi:AhpD family alkylhydroperoxidase
VTKYLALVATLSFATTAFADHTSGSPVSTTLAEVEAALGFVPQFVRNIPAPLLPGFWDEMKALEMNPNSALDAKTKELIGLAVASQIPCEYCVYFHTKAAKADGATDQQVAEAIGMAAMTRQGSTILNGTQTDLPGFKRDVDRIFKGKK